MTGLCVIGQVLAALAMAPGLLALGSRAADVGAPPDRPAPIAPIAAADAGDGACVLPGLSG
jgi:hypothetical protein